MIGRRTVCAWNNNLSELEMFTDKFRGVLTTVFTLVIGIAAGGVQLVLSLAAQLI